MIIYSARKWCRLALAGNPTVLLPLFVPDTEVRVRTDSAAELVGNAERFVSRLAAHRCLGCLNSQRTAMTGDGTHTNRPELVAAHGYDTKYAMHGLRLGIQGVELLTTGRITLPVPEPAQAAYGQSVPVRSPSPSSSRRLTGPSPTSNGSPTARHSHPSPIGLGVDGWLHRSSSEHWAATENPPLGR